MQSQPGTENVSDHFYTADDGIRLHFLFWPNHHSDSCCLLLHGFTNDAHIWDGLAAKLQTMHNVIAVDLRGHGDSDWDPAARYTHPQLVDDVYQLISKQPFHKWHIIGHSLGARIAMIMLAQKQLKPASFTIIDTGPEVRAIGVNKIREDAQNTPASFASIDAFYNYLSGIYLFGQPRRIRTMAQYGLKRDASGKLVCKTDPAFTKALWKSDRGEASNTLRYPLTDELWLALSRIQAPCLILRGQASAILSREVAEKMANIISRVDLKVITRAGHAMMVDNPEEFEQVVCKFIKDCSID